MRKKINQIKIEEIVSNLIEKLCTYKSRQKTKRIRKSTVLQINKQIHVNLL